jgi:hypothetical protein
MAFKGLDNTMEAMSVELKIKTNLDLLTKTTKEGLSMGLSLGSLTTLNPRLRIALPSLKT